MARRLQLPYTISSRRLHLKLLDQSYAASILDYYRRNRAFHDPWFPDRSASYFSLPRQREILQAEEEDLRAGRAVSFWLTLPEAPDRVIGRVAFSQIFFGSMCSAFTAWHLDQACQGQGLALEAGQAAIDIMFNTFGLHRLEAAILPANQRSLALARRLGFAREALSPRFLKINGVWQDHLRYVLLADGPLWPEQAAAREG